MSSLSQGAISFLCGLHRFNAIGTTGSSSITLWISFAVVVAEPLAEFVLRLRAPITVNELDVIKVEMQTKKANELDTEFSTAHPQVYPRASWIIAISIRHVLPSIWDLADESRIETDMRIVVLDGGTLNPGDLDWNVLKAFGQVDIYDESTRSEVIERAKHAEILLVNKVIIDAELLDDLPKLQMITVTATGYNNIDVEACKQNGVVVSNVINYGSTTVAQHVFALLLELTNRASRHHLLVQKGEWRRRQAFSFWVQPIIELAGKTFGIIGMGHIGHEVARIADGFRMKVQYHSSSGQSAGIGEAVNLEELIQTSDVISLHTHLHEENKHMVGKTFLDAMKPNAFLINTARGGLVDEHALYNALRHHQIGGAGLDVLEIEPPEDHHELLLLDNCIVTPHNAWASLEARQRLLELTVQNIQAFLEGKPNHVH